MGQYFVIANLDKKEYIEPRLKGLWEICANNDCRILPYLLATNNQDSTGLMVVVDGKPEDALRKLGKDKYEVVRYNEEANYTLLKRRLKYFGRWCGDRIAVVGDYADKADNYDTDRQPSFSEILETFRDITDGAVKEFNEFIGDDDLKVGKITAMSPDVVISAGEIHVNPRIKLR